MATNLIFFNGPVEGQIRQIDAITSNNGYGQNNTRLPPGLTRIKSWYHSKFQLILAKFSYVYFPPLSDLSEHSFEFSGPNIARIN